MSQLADATGIGSTTGPMQKILRMTDLLGATPELARVLVEQAEDRFEKQQFSEHPFFPLNSP
jgi:hypothetical protein